MDILRFGPDVEVLEPASLRSVVIKKINEMSKIYK
jgi:predicted DNA-binding transcriptional regulator YafY